MVADHAIHVQRGLLQANVALRQSEHLRATGVLRVDGAGERNLLRGISNARQTSIERRIGLGTQVGHVLAPTRICGGIEPAPEINLLHGRRIHQRLRSRKLQTAQGCLQV